MPLYAGYTVTPQDQLEDADKAVTEGAVRDRVELVKGEWFFDPDDGVPLFDEVLVKAPDMERVRTIYRTAVLGTVPGLDLAPNADGDLAMVDGDFVLGLGEGVATAEVQAELARQTRLLTVEVDATTESGQQVLLAVETP